MRVGRSSRVGLRGRGGFTLLEVMVALGILAVGLLGMLAMQVHAMRFGARGRHTSAAVIVAQDQMEQLQRVPFNAATLAATGGFVGMGTVNTNVQADQHTGGVDHVVQSFAVARRVTDVNPNLKAIDVRVTWNEPNRPNRSHSISSIRHNDP